MAPLVKVPALHKRPDLAVRHAALQHPEAAVGMDVTDPALAEHLVGVFDRPRDGVRRLDLGPLDVDNTEAEADLRAQVTEHLEFLLRTVRGFHDDVIDFEAVQIVHQLVPAALLHRLAPVIAEAEVDSGGCSARRGAHG